MTNYAAFLRGINVGGNHIVNMSDLRREFNRLGMQEIKTILQSGNVRFKASDQQIYRLESHIQSGLEAAFDFPIPVFLRTINTLKKIVAQKPFGSAEGGPDVHRFISFLKRPPKEMPPLPIISEDGAYSILSVSGANIFSVLDKTKATTPNVMNTLEKTFGKDITTRRLETVIKVLQFK